MALTNAYTITFGGFEVGGDSDTFLIDGPHVIERNYTTFRLVFDVVVTTGSFEELVTESQALEAAFSRRDVDLTIDVDGNPWEFESGTTLTNVVSSLVKSGDRQRDRGYGRAYTVTIIGELPASDRDGLRDLTVNVTYSASRQRIVAMRGSYTVDGTDSASEAYANNFDAEAATILTGISNTATFELVDENYTRDRLDHQAQFDRRYVELLANQSSGLLDAPEIASHTVRFTDLAQYPGTGQEGVVRLHRCYGEYTGAVDVTETTDLVGTYESLIRDHVVAMFVANFAPAQFAIEDSNIAYDLTASMLGAKILFVYAPSGVGDVLDVAQSTTDRTQRNLDYTPIHRASEYAANVDLGWAVRERVTTRTSVVLTGSRPRPLTTGSSSLTGSLNRSGWNTISTVVQQSPSFLGNPAFGQQIETSTITETIVERYHDGGGGGGTGSIIRPTPTSLGTV